MNPRKLPSFPRSADQRGGPDLVQKPARRTEREEPEDEMGVRRSLQKAVDPLWRSAEAGCDSQGLRGTHLESGESEQGAGG